VPTWLQELLDSIYAVFICGCIKHIERHGLPGVVKRRREWTYAVQVMVNTRSSHAVKSIRGEK
jgi:hypothetical protein